MKILLILFLIIAKAYAYDFNDSHFHLTNYIQEGIPIQQYLKIMGDKVGRSTLFGIPLQQQWSERISGSFAPTYYLQTDARLYYYSFTDAFIAMTYSSLSDTDKKRFDPMITGFNPTDMYAVDHIKRVLKTFPNVFVGLGEFTIHKEFVASKIAGDVASLKDKALDRILDFAAESGMVVILHNDIHAPFPKEGDIPESYIQIKDLFRRHKNATIIWAHVGLGRIIQPFGDHARAIENLLKDEEFNHVLFDISWSEVAKYLGENEKGLTKAVDLLDRYPDRFLFGTDEVAPKDEKQYYKIFHQYGELWKRLKPQTVEKIRIKNYERLFDGARESVRAWEKKNIY
jgi:predicted TIM-barrel fold metal-dependent hydrolase